MSTTSVASHPLRQTSFPPELGSQTPLYSPSRSPSVDTMSLVSGSVAGTKKKKSRKSKGKDNDDASARDVRAKSTVSAEGRARRRASRDQTAASEEEDEGGEVMAVNMAQSSKEEKAKEERRRHMLTRAFDEDQWSRFEAWRSSKLSDAVVRRVCYISLLISGVLC